MACASTATSPPAARRRTVPPGLILGGNLVIGGAGLAWVLTRFGGPALALLERSFLWSRLALFVASVALGFVTLALRWRIVLDGLGYAWPRATLTAYRAAGQSLSSIIPSAKLGGEPMRAYLLARGGVPAGPAIASVVVDRILEMGSSAAFAVAFAVLLVQRGVPALQGALVTVSTAAAALALGIVLTVRRLRHGRGFVSAAARSIGMDRLRLVRERMGVLESADEAATTLMGQPQRLARAFGLAVVANLVVLVEYHFLLSAFGLPAHPMAVVAAIFATGAAHSLPVPAAVGALEGAEMFLFQTLGYPPEVGLAIGLAVRLRELCWMVPGLGVLAFVGRGAIAAR